MIAILKDVFKRKDLLKYLVITHLKLSYANKVLGYFWSLLDPLAMMAVYLILVTIIFERKEPQFPILVFSSLLAWQWFTFSLSDSVNSLSKKSKIILSIKFPLAILPISIVLKYLCRYLLGLLVLIPMLLLFRAHITFSVLWFPVIVFIQGFFTIGLCLISAILGVYFQDMNNIIQFIIRIWFYGSPILYSIKDSISEKYQTILFMLNPFAAIFTSYKSIFVWGMSPTKYLWISFIISVICFISGLALFSMYEHKIPKDL